MSIIEIGVVTVPSVVAIALGLIVLRQRDELQWRRNLIRRPTDEEMELAKSAARMLRADHLSALAVVARNPTFWPGLKTYNWRFYGKKAS